MWSSATRIAPDRAAVIADRNRPLKHVQRAQTILFSADRLPVLRVARRAGVSRLAEHNHDPKPFMWTKPTDAMPSSTDCLYLPREPAHQLGPFHRLTSLKGRVIRAILLWGETRCTALGPAEAPLRIRCVVSGS